MIPGGMETRIGALSWQYPDRAGLPGVGAGPLGESFRGALIHTVGTDWETHDRQLMGNIGVGHRKPLVTEIAPAEVLEWLVCQ